MIVQQRGLGDITIGTDGLFPGVEQWGTTEWIVLGVSAYILYSALYTTKHHVGAVHGVYQRHKAKSKRRADLRRQLEEL